MGDYHPKSGKGPQPLCLFKLHLCLKKKRRHSMLKSVTVKSQMYDNVNGFRASTNKGDQIR